MLQAIARQASFRAGDTPNVDEPGWALTAWPSGFNTLTCGSAVERLIPDGLVKTAGWPSPFTRIGPAFPGECDAPIPEFAAHGGNSDESFRSRSPFGVWGLNAEGQLEDHAGTSFAAPLLAREAAFAFVELQKACAPGTKVYSATVKAYLALTAVPYPVSSRVRRLSERTLGLGSASAKRLYQPSANSAVFIWQGLLQGPEEIIRVQAPIPNAWLAEAESPRLRVVCAWDTPVNAAVRGFWGCRRVSVKLRTSLHGDAVGGSQTKHPTHPLSARDFDLRKKKRAEQEIRPTSDLWILEVSYKQVADYLSSMEFSPQQRVGLALELSDDVEEPTSPQIAVQAMPTVQSMIRLSTSAIPITIPVKARGR
ncbi:S8 family serine peptidase [Myxococcota bacterium]